MELDEFKAFYQAQFEQVPEKSGPDLEAMLQQRFHSAIERIMRNMLWEVSSALLMMLVLAVLMAIWSSTIFRWVGLGLVVVSIVQVVAFIWQYRQLATRLDQATGSVRNYLQELVDIISRFVKTYYRYCMRSIPVSALVGGALGVYMGITDDRTDPAVAALPAHPGILFLVISLALAISTIIGVYYLLKWYINHAYGRYLNELNHCLSELGHPVN
ncbi:hypothetical protein [Spirosoma fluviale]|uniref:Uncharacterized protein n=1 Tax=Spirosoma fluviale TaxID=1597977 RepID=A0A286GSC4_9BACT|nr:hypothetical protein [Spirosoma fluviale]SOD98443.1 hypothetical protein SAMN06269250_6087 [Spirosoma fluviale]